MVADGGEAVNGVGAHLVDDGAGEVGEVDEADGLAVGIGVGKLGPADGAGAAFDVLDHDGLADVLLGVFGEDAGGVVRAGACFVGDDHAYGAIGCEVRIGSSRQCKDHAQDEREGKDFFHGSFLLFMIPDAS